jgi:hypothetical protein
LRRAGARLPPFGCEAGERRLIATAAVFVLI